MRDTIIFSGASHTFGLGLEWELDSELNNEDYLKKGVHLPIPRLSHYEKYWKENRWPTLVSNQLGYKQYNILDMENDIQIGANAVETIWMLVRDENKIQHLLEKTKYIVLEIGQIRWYNENLHGSSDGHKYPNTILEMINLINNPESDNQIVSKTLQWINEVDPDVYMNELYDKIFYLQEKYKEIKFLILPWHSNPDGDDDSILLKNNIIPIIEDGIDYPNVNVFLQKNKIQVWNKAKAFNGDYEYNYREDHASVEGHKRVANMVINHIKKIENE
jgi:hypothetical protein